jgi:ribosomal protein S18 acetylase RimI-like enzyme
VARGVPGADGHELRSVWVSPVVRGLGVGDRLLTEVETWARRSGAPCLRLAVLPRNEAATTLYRRHGYLVRTATTEQVLMIKPLA